MRVKQGNDLLSMRQCTAKSKRTGKRCTSRAMIGKSVCYHHGGRSPGGKKGNKSAVITGRYEKIFPDCLTPEEQARMEGMNTIPLAVVEEELRLTRIRETRILQRIKKVRDAEEVAGTPTGEKNEDGNNILHTPMVLVSSSASRGPQGSTRKSESEAHSVHILKLENALTAVQAQLGKLIDQKSRLLTEAQEAEGASQGEAYQGIKWEGIAPSFLDLVRHVKSGTYTHYRVKGGRGSTKSSTIAKLIVDGIICNPDTHAVVMRDVFNTSATSTYTQLQWAIEELGQSHNFIFKKSPLEIVYRPTGQRILFRGLDDPQKLKSIKLKFGYVAWIWYEEASEIRGGMETVRNVNQSLMRGGDKFTVFLSYNPPKSKNNWINVSTDEQVGRNDTFVHASTYLTVPLEWLGKQFILEAEALKEVNPKAYEHEYLGVATGTGGDVFDNVAIEVISNETIAALDMVRRGIDFGFKPDPFAFIQTGYNRLYDTLYIYDEVYKPGLHDDEAAAAIQGKGVNREVIYADCEDPKGISNLQREGLSGVRGCSKPPKSREHGYKYLQRWKRIVIDPARCPNAMREFVGCEFERDKDGNFLSVIPKKNDHTIDATRYSHEQEIRDSRPATSQPVSSRAYAA